MPRLTQQVVWMLVAFLCVAAVGPARSAAAETSIVRILDEVDVDSIGNVTGESELVLSQEQYTRLKTLMSPRESVQENGQWVTKLRPPQVQNVLRYLGLTSTAYEVSDVKGEFDDEATAIRITYRIQGRCAYRHGQWVFGINHDPDLKVDVRNVVIQGRTARLEFRTRQQDVQNILRYRFNLPEGVQKIDFRKKSLELVYTAPPPPTAADRSAARPAMRFDCKPQLMSALYKLYGNPKWIELWPARSVFENETPETLADYRVRFRIEGYSNWSPWQRSDKVFPGQTVVDAFYPVIDAKVTGLKGSTPAQVELEYEYTRPNGDRVSESESGRIRLLGMNEALWSSLESDRDSTWYDVFRNGPMVLSSFTSATDPVMLDVLGMVGKAIGGRGAATSDENALVFLGTLFNLLRQNIAYETTSGEVQTDGLLHQHLKYGRDVLRSRSGTCVNLSILYASVCEAAGLKSYIVLGPGHAFAAARLPQSGTPVLVETTLCGGGTKETSGTFREARESALRTYLKWSSQGLLIEVDIDAARRQGVTPPELPEIGTNPLKEWAITPPELVEDVTLPRLLVAVKSTLDGANYKYVPVDGRTAVSLEFNNQHGEHWTTIFQTLENVDLISTVTFVPKLVPEDDRPDVVARLAELNGGLWHGNYEITPQGRITYRTSINVRGGELTASMVQQELDYHLEQMNKHLTDLQQYATEEPDAAPAEGQPAEAEGDAGSETTEGEPDGDEPEGDAGDEEEEQAAAASHPLVGTWKAVFTAATGRQVVQLVVVREDGTYTYAAADQDGNATQSSGEWEYEDGVFTTTSDAGAVHRGKLRRINRDRFVFHDDDRNVDVTYERYEPE